MTITPTASGTPDELEASTHVARGYDRVASSDYVSAREYFDEAIRLDPACARAYGGRGLAWHYLGESSNALSDYDHAIRLGTPEARVFLNRGALRQRGGDIDQAIIDYGEAARLDPKSPEAYRYRANARIKKEEWQHAIDDLTEVIRLRPEDPQAYLQRASAWTKLEQADKSLADLDDAIRLDPRMTDALERRSAMRHERGEHAGAERDTTRAREIQAMRAASRGPQRQSLVASLIREHFHPTPTDNLSVTQREFPLRIRADLLRATDLLFRGRIQVLHCFGVHQSYSHEGLDFVGLLVPSEHDPAVSVPVAYEEIDIGEEASVRCPKNAIWLLESDGNRFALLAAVAEKFGRSNGIRFQVATVNSEAGTRISGEFFKHLEDAVLRSESYRGKVLSLETKAEYLGTSSGLRVHKLKSVRREEVILPRATLELLDRNVLGFADQRQRIARFGLPTRKGILLYGPPGTGKTHTIHYLARALKGYTTLLITAGQMGCLSEYMTLARLLQPCVVVMEDVDLIARDRQTMEDGCSESLLNRLLNEMDGLQEDADLFFIMTTNRPESLERALASRPGRIDQAIEYPLPDDECREKLVRLNSQGLVVSESLVHETVARTRGVSASFIRELMRRSAQFHLERGAVSGELIGQDLAGAMNELIAGTFNRKLLGADSAASSSN